MSELNGKMLGRYRLESLLGTGGMAEVYRASDTQLGRTVAIKVILPSFAREASFRERFDREARLVAALQHPHILPLYDIGEADGLPFLVMPYVEGGSLADRLAQGPQPPDLAVRWIAEIASALDAAHSAGILHRDVKPSNVLLDRNDRALLADFGIAQAAGQATRLTATGAVIGTPGYMAPELVRGEPASPASDRYALAVLAFELLSGRPPFTAEHPLAVLHRQLSDPVPPITQRTPTAPAAADEVFDRALAKAADERPPSAVSFASRLAHAWNQQTLAPTLALPGSDLPLHAAQRPAGEASSTVASPGRATSKARSYAVATAIAVVGIAAGLGLYRWATGSTHEPEPVAEVALPSAAADESPTDGASPARTSTNDTATDSASPYAISEVVPPAASTPRTTEPPPSAPPSSHVPASAAVETAPAVSTAESPAPTASELAAGTDVLLELSGNDVDAPPGNSAAGIPGGRRGPGGRLRPGPGARLAAQAGLQALRMLVSASEPRFERIAQEARDALVRAPQDPVPQALALYAEAGLAALRGDEAGTQRALGKLAEVVSALPPQMLGLGPLALLTRRPPGPFQAWESAVLLGDPRGDGLSSVDQHLREHPDDARALFARGALRALHGEPEAARADIEASCAAGFIPACRRADSRRRLSPTPP